MDLDAIKDALGGWIRSVTGVPAIDAFQNAPAPGTPYATMYLNSFSSFGTSSSEGVDENGEEVQVQDRSFVLVLQFFGEGAMGKALSLVKDAGEDGALQEAGVVYLDEEGPIDLTGIDGERWEERAALDIRMTLGDEKIQTPGVIESVDINSEYF